MRLFVSIDLPDSVQQKLYTWMPDRQDLRYTNMEQLHLTLLFLGECEEDQVSNIIQQLKAVPITPFEMIIQGIGAFPDRENPRVIWAGVKSQPEMFALQKEISSQLAELSDEGDNRPFKPHITLARTKRSFRGEEMDQRFEPGESISMNVNSFSLKKSELTPNGSTHTVLKKFVAE